MMLLQRLQESVTVSTKPDYNRLQHEIAIDCRLPATCAEYATPGPSSPICKPP